MLIIKLDDQSKSKLINYHSLAVTEEQSLEDKKSFPIYHGVNGEGESSISTSQLVYLFFANPWPVKM